MKAVCGARPMSEIDFETSDLHPGFLNPFGDFREETHTVQVRRDPLLGDVSLYNPRLKEKVKFFFGDVDAGLIAKMAEESARGCIFCPERREANTPRFPPDLIPEGRIRIGEAELFPNLFPVAGYHAVIVLSRAHFLPLSGFTPGIIFDGLKVARRFVDAVYQRDESAAFVAVNANYLFPAGATLVHPHLQLIVNPFALSYQARLHDACRRYQHTHGTGYFSDLTEQEEKRGARSVARTGGWHWLTAFSPTGNNEVIAVHQAAWDFAAISEADLMHLADGISRVLACYETLGHLSFNYSLLSVRQSSSPEGFRCLLKIISRQNPYPNYRNDDYFLQKLLQAEVIVNLPEELAARLRGFFERQGGTT